MRDQFFGYLQPPEEMPSKVETSGSVEGLRYRSRSSSDLKRGRNQTILEKISTHSRRNFTDSQMMRDLIQLGGHRTQGARNTR
jgi:hypothetical protein